MVYAVEYFKIVEKELHGEDQKTDTRADRSSRDGDV